MVSVELLCNTYLYAHHVNSLLLRILVNIINESVIFSAYK